jgi:lipoate-protein ligase A
VEATVGERKDLWLPEGYKITGTASQIRKNRELHHGTLLVDTDLELLQQALFVSSIDTTVKATLSVRSKTRNILDYLREKMQLEFSAVDFMAKLIAASEKYYNSNKLTATDFDQAEIGKLEANYQSDAWNYRK